MEGQRTVRLALVRIVIQASKPAMSIIHIIHILGSLSDAAMRVVRLAVVILTIQGWTHVLNPVWCSFTTRWKHTSFLILIKFTSFLNSLKTGAELR